MNRAAAGVLLVLVAVVIYNVRQGTMGDWFRAKFFGAGSSPGPARKRYATVTGSFGTGGGGLTGSTGGIVRADASTMVQIPGIAGGVHPVIADNVRRMIADAAADGITLTGGGYRSPQRQIELREQHCGPTQYDIYEKPSSQCTPPTARPGSSRHETGRAIDFNNASSRDTAVFRWLAANAARYGLRNLPSEPWHWSVDGQ